MSILGSLDNKSAAGEDGIKASPVKAVAHDIAKPLTHIFNEMISSGIYPDRLKIARVTLLHKGGKCNELGNYRPISVLSIFAKVAEKVLCTRFNKFLSAKNVIVEQQFGFQKGKSTEKALVRIKDKIIQNIENRLFTVAIYLDFQKAFDSIKHEILFRKLEAYGFRGKAQNLIRSYLHNRLQYICLQDAQSEETVIKYGVPQGSGTGPLYYL
uniref:Putative tick transposon n=1 Tax=Rhipicephalus microplus TaxID=6941 RepID=A0A6G5ABT2_RHIMP